MKQLKTTTISSSAHSKKAHGVLTNAGLVFLEHSWMRAKPEAAAIDSFQVHHGKPVKAGVEDQKDKTELFYLPSYSPELNPKERLNSDLENALNTKASCAHKEQAENGDCRANARGKRRK